MDILVIDDDSAMTDLLRLLLQPVYSNFFSSNKGAEGVRLAREHMPDIIILDLVMPDMTGWEVCSAIRKFSTKPILVLSAMDDPSVIAKVLNAGADDYVIKPVTKSILVATINKLFRRSMVDPVRVDAKAGALTSAKPHHRPTGAGM
jgi:DNA-binding response OmpR family regulator